MCGFVGVLEGNIRKQANKKVVESLGELLIHRGPDEFDSFSDGPYAVSHRRLRIIDLTVNGRQPMQNTAGTISIAHNGEVYNFRELKEKYALDKKFKFKSKTDTEVLLYLYELLGIDFIHELNGMFAVAIWDNRKKKLYLIRDRFGIKPLFYTVVNNSFWFASEIKSLLKIPGFKKEVCLEAMHHYFSFDYIPGEITAFEGIKEVRPGFYLEVCGDPIITIKKKKYWHPTYDTLKLKNRRKIVNEIKELLINSVTLRLISDVPIGVMLSGGIDSSTLTLLMSQIRKDSNFHTFSVGFDEESFDEASYAETVAKEVGTIHHNIRITPDSIIDNIENYLLYIDEPYADGSAIPTYLLSKEAKKYVTVLLSGEGGDEVFAGYETHLAYFARKWYRKFLGFTRNIIKYSADLFPVSHKKLSFGFKLKKFVNGAEKNIPISHYKWREVFTEDEKKELFDLDMDLEAKYSASSKLFEDCFNNLKTSDDLNKLLEIDCTFHLPDDLMIKNDRMTMAHSLEARVPFTDIKLFEYLSKFSGTAKLHNFKLKYLLKESMRNYLPKNILAKKKIGLEIPYSKWFCTDLKELLLSNLSPNTLKDIPFLNTRYIQKIIKEHIDRKKDRGRELWGLLNFSIWYRLYFIESKYS